MPTVSLLHSLSNSYSQTLKTISLTLPCFIGLILRLFVLTEGFLWIQKPLFLEKVFSPCVLSTTLQKQAGSSSGKKETQSLLNPCFKCMPERHIDFFSITIQNNIVFPFACGLNFQWSDLKSYNDPKIRNEK